MRSGKSSTFLSPFFILLLIAALSYLFVKPVIEEILATKENIKSEQQRLVKLTEKVSYLTGLDKEKLTNDVKTTSIALPSEKDVPMFLNTVDLLAKDASISVTAIQLNSGKISTSSGKLVRGATQEVADSMGGKVPINLTIEGQFAGVKDFITRMTKSLPLESLRSIDFTRSGGKEGVFGLVAANFSLEIHYKLLPKSLPKVSDPVDKLSADEEKLLTEIINYTQPKFVTTFIPVGREDPFAKP